MRTRLSRFLQSTSVWQSLIVFVGVMLANALGYIYHMLCSRRLGIEEYGVLATLVAGYSMFGAVVAVLTTITAKFTAEFVALDDQPRMRMLARTMMRVCCLKALAVSVVAFFALPVLSVYLHIDTPTLAVGIAAIATSFLLPAWRGMLQGLQAYRELAISTTLEAILRVLSGVAFAWWGYGAFGAMTGFVVGNVFSLAYTWYALRRHVAIGNNQMLLALDLRRLVQTSAHIVLSTTALTSIGFVDVLLARHFLSAQDAGLYGVLSLTGKIIIFSVSFLPTILLPKAVALVARGESAQQILWRAITVTIGFSGIVVALYFAIPTLIVKVMAGSAFLAVAPSVGWYGVATALLAATTLVATYKIGIHQFGFIPGLLLVAALEIMFISYFHRDIAMIVQLVIWANLAALLATVLPERVAKRAAVSQGIG